MVMLLLSLLGCFSSPFEGTWLFAANPEASYEGDCAPAEGYSYTGQEYAWVDIYKATDGQFVALLEEALVGEPDGSTLTLNWSHEETGDAYRDSQKYTLVANLKGGSLSGKFVSDAETVTGEDAYACTTTTLYTAERATSNPDLYLEN